MKICMISAFFYPNVGGVETHMYEIGKRLVKKGHEVTIICTDRDHHLGKASDQNVERKDGIKILRFTPWLMAVVIPLMGTVFYGGISTKPLQYLIKEKPDIVHFHNFSFSYLGMTSLLYSRMYGVPLVVTPHYHEQETKRFDFQQDLWSRIISKSSKRIFVVSKLERELISERYGISKDKIRVVYNGIDYSLLKVKPKYGDFLLYVGSGIEERKGLKEILEIFESVRREYSDIRLMVVGEDTDQDQYKTMVDLETVKFFGKVDEIKLKELYEKCYMFVLPSKYEAFGIVLAEAMACGKPVVTTRIGGIPEVVIDGETGILVPVDDTQAMKEAILRLLRDPELAKEMGKKGRERVKSLFTWDHSAESLDKYLKEIE